MPDARLTPDVTLVRSRSLVCAEPGDGNKIVPIALRREVFREYGIPGADPSAYEWIIGGAVKSQEDAKE